MLFDTEAMAHPHDQGDQRILADPQQATLALKPCAFLQVGVIFVQIHIPKMLHGDHVLVAFLRVLIG